MSWLKNTIGQMSPVGNMLQRQKGDAESMPQYETVQLDPDTQKQLDYVFGNAQSSTDTIASEMGEGVPEAGRTQLSGLSGALARSNRGLGGDQNEALGQALSKRAEKSYMGDVNKIQRQIKLNAEAQKAQRLQRVSELYARKQNQVIQDAANENQSLLDRAKARNGVIGGALGMAGQLVGSLFGGMGGMAGGKGNQQQSQPNLMGTADYQNYGMNTSKQSNQGQYGRMA